MKTEDTLSLERDIWKATNKQGVFGCLEVTIGWFGDERVDYMTYDTKGIFRCYEIKASKSDFYSSAKKTFVGHFNYFVLTKELYEQVKEDIPRHVGVYVGSLLVKKAKRQELKVDEQILKDSLIRSLSRDVDKLFKSADPEYTNRMTRIINKERKEKEEYRTKFWNLQHRVWEKYGTRWDREQETATS
ncbi:hypothetical protein COLU111180_04200 [Cohnella lubricantis]|uniref:MmcB family DNA repair protein n=1 Tax=Cohnella lubricantis TaxID=2163172 RepID=A0A841T6H6_9BACL|nr:hypothetical protein [Cohnella lubricantis]MBB6676492.1 hypothetical protein [Cohnella lubricantis]MBP2117109.1 hypothetical protein [Cohnella lubricantis]